MNEILLQSFLIFLFGGCVVGILVGAAMLLKPEQLARFNELASRWISTEKFVVRLDRRRRIEPFVYRNNRLTGAAVLVGAVFVLHTFLFRYNLRIISTFIPQNYWWLSDALVAMLLIGGVLAALVGGIMLIKPSLLRNIEASANHWVCTECISTWFNARYHFIERFILSHHRFYGAFILFVSLYVLVVIGDYLFFGEAKL